MTILVVGGAGYIGSNTVDLLVESGYDVCVLDNLSTGFKQAIHPKALFVQGDVRDKGCLERIFTDQGIEAVIDFAALSLGRDSMQTPLVYFDNNVGGTLTLLEVMARHHVHHLVFSSSATVYGNAAVEVVDESTPVQPINPYGETKVMMEKIIDWQSQVTPMNYVALRYFNVAGAKSGGSLGEYRPRLLPIILDVASGKREQLTLFGDDYPTADGSCIRDYIHVTDLAQAHVQSLTYLLDGGESQVLNVGSASGFSNLALVEAAQRITGRPIPVDIQPRNPGDAGVLVASNTKIQEVIGWQPRYSDIDTIISDAWLWHQNYPEGYAE